MVIFFDIDGTIVDEKNSQIPPSCIRAVERLVEYGHIPIINTGRPFTHIDERVRAMAFRGYSCGCGMQVQLDGQWLHHVQPDKVQRWKAIEAARKYNMKPFYETADGAILLDGEQSRNRFFSWDDTINLGREFTVRQIADHPEAEFLKLVAFREENSDVDSYIRELENDYTIINRGNFMYELVLKGCSKAEGMRHILRRLAVDRADTMAIGDSSNDLPMFQLAGHTVCMGNGMEEMKAVCEFVTDSVLNDGVEKALIHYGLI